MYSGTIASYRYGRTVRGHYPYVATHQPIWTTPRQVETVPFPIAVWRTGNKPNREASIDGNKQRFSGDASLGGQKALRGQCDVRRNVTCRRLALPDEARRSDVCLTSPSQRRCRGALRSRSGREGHSNSVIPPNLLA